MTAEATPEQALTELLTIMARLRDPDNGCPWDRQQDFASIAPYTLEEAYEVVDAIRRHDFTDLRDELGDLLLQVVFHAQMASEQGRFDFADVASAINRKMVRRHPHVFGDAELRSAEEQTLAWEQLKAAERADKPAADSSALAGVARTLPALTRAEKLGKRASRAGFDWADLAGVWQKLEEELGELQAELPSTASVNEGDAADRERLEDELGDLLFCTVNLARHLKLDPEQALRRANNKFERRFRALEQQLPDALADYSVDELEAVWQLVKRQLAESAD